MARNIVDVIDKITETAPDLKPYLESLRTSCGYTAPEMMVTRWHDLAAIMETHAPITHPKFAELIAIVNDVQ